MPMNRFGRSARNGAVPALVNWRGVGVALTVLAGGAVVCAVNLRCGGDPLQTSTAVRIRDELAAGRREARMHQADDLSVLARDMRALARRYVEKGDRKKAQRAIGAAQELDKRINELRSEEK